MALTTGNNTWASGLDVVVEGRAVRVSDDKVLRNLADAWEAKYGSEWHWEVADGMFRHSGRWRSCRLQDRAHEGPRIREGPARPDDVSVLVGERGAHRLA